MAPQAHAHARKVLAVSGLLTKPLCLW